MPAPGTHPVLAFTSAADNVWETTELTTGSLPIGLFEDSAFEARTYTVPVGCRMVLFSDGAFELPLPGGRLWRLADFADVAKHLAASGDFSADALVAGLRARAVNGEFDDDCSVVTLTFR